jgi:tetratricopeptide (TPR) repeat protein
MARQRRDDPNLALALARLGDAHRAGGDPLRAVSCFREAIAVNDRTGNRRGQAATWTSLGAALCESGNRDGAAGAWRHALTLLEELRDPAASDVRHRLDALTG